jgi:hypothetical protein
MTPRQKRLIGVLVLVNSAVTLGLADFVARLSPATSLTSLPTPVPRCPPARPSAGLGQTRASIGEQARADALGTGARFPIKTGC